MSELCQMKVLTDTVSKDLDQLIGYYTRQPFQGSDDAADNQKLKYEYFLQVRDQSAKLQDDLFKLFTSSILMSLVEPEEADGQFCWDESVSGHLFKAFGFLIVQSLMSYCWH